MKVLKWLTLALGLVLAVAGRCQAADAVAVPPATSLIVDQARALSEAQRRRIEARLKEVQDGGRAQIGVLIARGTGDEALAAYALRVVEAWKLGSRSVDNGLLILIVPSQGTARIEVGYGLEGDIPDLRAAQFVREYLQRARAGDAATALDGLIDRIVQALPAGAAMPPALARFIAGHAEWKLPIVLLVMSVFTLLPLLFTAVFSRGGALAGGRPSGWPAPGLAMAAVLSGALYAAVLGFAARIFWDAVPVAVAVAGAAFVLPLLWSLDACDASAMSLPARLARGAGSLGLCAYIFGLLTTVAVAAMIEEQVHQIWVAPLLALLFAVAVPAFLQGGRVGAGLMQFLGYYLYFLVALAITWFALDGLLRDPTATAVTVSAVFTGLVAIGIVLDDREDAARRARRKGVARWAWMFTAAAVLFLIPFMLVAAAHAVSGDDFHTRFAAVMAGDGSLSSFVWWASAALGGSALLVGLGGRFGGGGASG